MNNKSLGGIGKSSRQSLSSAISNSKGYLRASEIAIHLKISNEKARWFLASWAKGGWVKRIAPGLYIPVDNAVESPENVIVDPWVLVTQLYSPCYVGGWSACEHWGFTDQIFTSLIVLTDKRVNGKEHKVGNLDIYIKHQALVKHFGTKTIWKDALKVYVSDPHKTIIDIMDDPHLGGGIRSVTDMLKKYFTSEHFSVDKLLSYAEKMNNKTIYKRMGYLVSLLYPEEKYLIEQCLTNISKGISQIDLDLKGKIIIKKWRLRLPEGFSI